MKFAELNIEPEFPLMGTKESITNLIDKEIQMMDFKFIEVSFEDGIKPSVQIQFVYPGENVKRITFTRSKITRKQLEQIDKSMLPINVTFRHRIENGKKSLYME